MTITDKHAVKIAEWLEKEITYIPFPGRGTSLTPCVKVLCGQVRPAIEWLLSPEGQEALMDKLLANKFSVFFERYVENTGWLFIPQLPRPPNLIEVEIERDGDKGSKCIVVATEAPTRQEALINSVLETLEVPK